MQNPSRSSRADAKDPVPTFLCTKTPSCSVRTPHMASHVIYWQFKSMPRSKMTPVCWSSLHDTVKFYSRNESGMKLFEVVQIYPAT